MKRRYLAVIFVLLLLPILVVPANAEPIFIHDYANIVTNEQESQLTELVNNIQNLYGIEVAILTTPGLYGQDGTAFADSFYKNNHYSSDCILFHVEMGTRSWYISTYGIAEELLTQGDLAAIEEKVIPLLSNGRYFDAFYSYLQTLPKYLESDAETQINLLLSLGVGAVIATVLLFIMRSTMNTKNSQHDAASYESDGSYHLRTHQDLFLYSNITKHPKPQNNNSGSRSRGGRSGKF